VGKVCPDAARDEPHLAASSSTAGLDLPDVISLERALARVGTATCPGRVLAYHARRANTAQFA